MKGALSRVGLGGGRMALALAKGWGDDVDGISDRPLTGVLGSYAWSVGTGWSV